MTKQQLLTSIIGIFTFAVVFSACSSQSTTSATPTAAPTAAVNPAGIEETSLTPGAEESMQPAETMEMSTEVESAVVKDGDTITGTGAYTSPGGAETIKFVLEVDDKGVITEAKAEPQGTNPTTKIRQGAFAAEVGKVMVGKNLKELTNVARIGGSSLTTGAFNTFLAEAKTKL